jgi:hypothetical protein
MILGFSTQLCGKPTYFPEKIVTGLEHKKIITLTEADNLLKSKGIVKNGTCYVVEFDKTTVRKPKLHTLRDDPNDRWYRGKMIDFFINVRKKNMFRFAPKLPVVSTQKVYMTYAWGNIIEISVGNKQLVSQFEREQFAINDGFDNWDDFFNYFYPKIRAAPKELYKPKLIHWTDLRY